MAGVNLSEESARILATNSELVGTLTRSCKDETFLLPAPLQRRILEIGAFLPRSRHWRLCPQRGLVGTVTFVLWVKLPVSSPHQGVCLCHIAHVVGGDRLCGQQDEQREVLRCLHRCSIPR